MFKLFYIAIYLIICAAYFIWWHRMNREEAFYRLVMVLAIPIVGFILLFALDYFCRYHKTVDNIAALCGIENPLVKEGFAHLNVSREINIAPFEEVLALSPVQDRRKMIINTLKKDIDQYIGVLEQGLNDEDTETSHYAASAIMEIRRKLTIALQEFGVKYEKDKDNFEIASGYAAIIKRYLHSGLLDRKSYNRALLNFAQILAHILTMPEAEEAHYIDKLECDLELGDYLAAKECADRFSEAFPENEGPYLMRLKLYYSLRDKVMFNQVINEFKQSKIPFSNYSLNMVRYWSEVIQ